MSETVGNNGAKMKEINIYLYSSIKGGKAKNGAYTYLLEMPTQKGPVTLSKTEKVEGMTVHKSELCALAAALKRIMKSSRLVIYTDSGYLATNARDCLASWKKNGWKTAKGKQVKNLEEWQTVYQLIRKHSFKFVVSAEHSYYQRMKEETEAAAECM